MKATTTQSGSATDVDNYLATVSDEARGALEKLRQAIRAAAPEATEALSFDHPAFILNGQRLVQYWASKGHCSLYVMTPAFVKAHAEDLKGYDASGATIRFLANKPTARHAGQETDQDAHRRERGAHTKAKSEG